MLKSNQLNVATVINKGAKLYMKTFMEFKKYALLLVFVSSLISIYMVFIEFFIDISYTAYIIGYVLLLVLFIPFAYYAIVTSISVISKLKSIIENDYKKTFREHYKRAKQLFWRMVLFIIIEGLLVVCLFIILLIAYVLIDSILGNFNFLSDSHIIVEGIIVIVTLLAAVLIVYLLTRIGFTELVIFWDIKFDSNAIIESFKLTRYDYLKKVQIIIIAQLPNFIFTIFVFWINFKSSGGLLSIFELGLSMAINIVLLPWSYCIYYSLLNEMNVFKKEEAVEDGIKWQLY